MSKTEPGSMRVRIEDDGWHYLEIFKRDGTWATWDRYETMAMAKEGARRFPFPPDGHTRTMCGDIISGADLVDEMKPRATGDRA